MRSAFLIAASRDRKSSNKDSKHTWREGGRSPQVLKNGGPGITTVFARLDSAILNRLVVVVDASGLRVPIAATYHLAQAAAALTAF